MTQIFLARPSGETAGAPRFAPLDADGDRELYLRCYAQAWRAAHGTLAGFDADALWRGALYRASASPEAVQCVWLGGEFAGLLALDERREAARGVGWLSFCYVEERLRRRGLGSLLVDTAAARFRALGRRSLRLCAAEGNPAMAFYQALGFVRLGTEPGALEPLALLEKDLGSV